LKPVATSEVVCIGSANVLNEAVETEAFKNAGHLTCGLVGRVVTQGFVLKAEMLYSLLAKVSKRSCSSGVEEGEA
jgi:hypothetical protein